MEQRARKTLNREFRKLEIEENFTKRHENWIQNQIEFNRQKIDSISEEDCQTETEEDVQMGLQEINIDILIECLQFISQKPSDKGRIIHYLKLFRKELSKTNMTSEVLSKIYSSNVGEGLLINLVGYLFDYKNSEIQLESIWILNNLCIFSHQFQFQNEFYHIHEILVKFMQNEKSFSNSGVRNLIFEKFFALIGNLILYDESVFHYYINNGILLYLIKNLNSSVRSLRVVCLWTLNNIISAVKVNITTQTATETLLKECLFHKDTIYYIRYLFSRVDPSKNLEECFEYFWLVNHLISLNPPIAYDIFFCGKKEDIMKTLKSFWDMLMIEKLHQPVVRIFSNLISLNDNNNLHRMDVINLLIEDKITQLFFSSIIQSYYHIDKDLLLDVLLLLFNLSCWCPQKVEMVFLSKMNDILNFASLVDDKELITIILNINYRILYSNDFSFSTVSISNDSPFINFIFKNSDNLIFDSSVMHIVLDVLLQLLQQCNLLSELSSSTLNRLENISKKLK